MFWTFIICLLLAFFWICLFYLWGRAFLSIIRVKSNLANSVLFGYLLLQVIFQIIYMPLYIQRSSYRNVAYIWLGVVFIFSILFLYFLMARTPVHKEKRNKKEILGISIATALILGLAVFISLHVTYYGQDTVVYITEMNESYYRDSMWLQKGTLYFHSGMSSFFQFFTISSLLTGIKPYYIALFMVRIIGVCLTSFVTYQIGSIVFPQKGGTVCWSSLVLAVLIPYLLMFWGSPYTAEFFYWRIYEAKGFCQFVLLPTGFSIFLAMFKGKVERKKLWKEQFLVGLASVSVSASSLTPYLFLLFVGTCSLLVYDKFRNGWRTFAHVLLCAFPNIIYLTLYILDKNGIFVL